MFNKYKLLIKNFNLTYEEYKKIENEKKCYENPQSALISALTLLQKNRGWIDDNTISSVAKIFDVSISDVECLATFYSQIFRKAVGKHIIRYCDSIVCFITGYKDIENEIIRQLNIRPGQTTFDNRFTLLPVCCLGNCNKAPTIMIDDNVYNNLNFKDIKKLLEDYD
ncbi:NADH-quinone oxidoreductase subunit E [Candidatus Providencia siddallii]|uniref:NADH-quinone oxidoreductase subunit E n=2 Tax=Candidatus Providencia siddallii TaxID=1715285 RepID=A0ABP1CDG9_9GAMM